jgi:hypothetical protein
VKWLSLLWLIALPALAQVEPPESGSQPGDLDGGQPIEASTRCQQCHDRAISNDGDPLYLPYDTWASTMMGNSMRDPLFQAAVAVANQDVPGVGSWCYRCHSPQSYVRGDNAADGGLLDDVDRDGVTCDVCHRAIPNPQTSAYEHGNAQIFFERTNVKYGPYDNVDSPAHLGADAGFVSTSELCGNCHQVENPLVPWRDSSGNTLGPRFPLDTTYDEWKQSQYAQGPNAKTCHDCHMPRVVGADGGTQWYVAKFGMLRDSPRQHVFVGGNVWGVSAVKANDPAHAAALTDQFAQTTQLAQASLQSAADLAVSIEGASVKPGDSANVTVRVTNKTGHKLPTGYADGRRIVLQLVVNGEVHTGGFDGGELGDDGWLHVYQAQHGRAGAGVEDHLAQHDTIVADSRIPPAGFHPPPGAATRPVAVPWFDLPDGGFSNVDVVTWDIDVPTTLKDGDRFDVTARLLYQSTTPEYVGFLHDANVTTDAGQNLVDIFHATGDATPIEMAHAEASVPVSTGATPDAGGSTADAGTDGGTSPGGGGHPCGCGSPGALLALLGVLVLRRRRN